VRRELAALGGEASAQLFSALKKTGLDEARGVIAGWLDAAE